MHKKRKINMRLVRGIIFILVGVISLIWVFKGCSKQEEEEVIFFPEVEEAYALVDLFTLYGRFFNLEGKIDLNINGIKDVNIVIKSKDKAYDYDTNYEIQGNTLSFVTNKVINEGLILDDLNEGDYYILLEVVKDAETRYYLFKNNSEYEMVDYYTLTKDNKNNYVVIDFMRDSFLEEETFMEDYMKINVLEKTLPSDIYDIVIDPGHGGVDPGAVSGNMLEKDYTLPISKKLKEALEDLGYKVLLTREEDIDIDTYGEEGRAVIPNNVRSKYLFSIHLNSMNVSVTEGGVEVYVSPNSNLELARSIALNIKEMAKTKYSFNDKYKKEDGIYSRAFLQSEIEAYSNKAIEAGYDPYLYTKDTPYHYILREPGGIVTGAYVDGRNPDYKDNPYYNSNFGVEAYILELGYIIAAVDMENIKNNMDKYVEGIVKGISDYLK